jgi:hypothetical protein
VGEPVFLGVLVDPSVEEIPKPYQELERNVAAIVERYHEDGDEDTAYRRLAAQRIQDDIGNIWTVGATSGRWKVKPVGSRRWTPGHPALPPQPED